MDSSHAFLTLMVAAMGILAIGMMMTAFFALLDALEAIRRAIVNLTGQVMLNNHTIEEIVREAQRKDAP